MTEQIPAAAHPESSPQDLQSSREHREHLDRLEATGKAQEDALRSSTEQIRNTVEQEAVSGLEFSPAEHQKQPNSHHHGTVTRELRTMTFKRALVRLQKRQTKPDKVLSKFIHQGAVDVASEALGKTIARPSGLIGGGLLALLSTTVLLFTARHYGFRYNYLVFFCTFAIGMLVGQICEMAVKLLRRRN